MLTSHGYMKSMTKDYLISVQSSVIWLMSNAEAAMCCPQIDYESFELDPFSKHDHRLESAGSHSSV